MFRINFILILLLLSTACSQAFQAQNPVVGAAQTDLYLPLIKDKRVGVVVNNTSMIGDEHLVDVLLGKNVKVDKIFAPEHGFRGDVANGGEIVDGVDAATGLHVYSLYGENRKPTAKQLKDLDVMIFDIQDVGCRFYTYISTLHLVLEACAENNVPLVVLDRPNPNGDYVAGPIRKEGFQSFVGMDPIPIVHGCTVGELAQMINGENWYDSPDKCDLTVIGVKNYDHKTLYLLPERPSPNLPNDLAVRLYPSLCFFEATSVSIGRGTDFPFQVIGGPNKELGTFEFIPRSIRGVSDNPLHKNQICYGIDLRELKEVPTFTLKYFLDFYYKFQNQKDFLTRERWLNLLAGTDDLIEQIRAGKTEAEILKSWKPELEAYKALRKKYLLYPDFE